MSDALWFLANPLIQPGPFSKRTGWLISSLCGEGTSMVTIRVKSGLFQFHLNSAARFASACAKIESEEMHLEWPQPRWDEARSNALAAVLLAAASLESSVNELFQQAVDRDGKALKSLSEIQMKHLEEIWGEIEKLSPLRKHQIALVALGYKPMNTGQEPYRSADGLMRLRNALVHFKPKWDDSLKDHGALERRLSQLFPVSALAVRAKGEMVWFPHKCLGAGCAEWAIESALSFSQKFVKTLGIRGRLKRVST